VAIGPSEPLADQLMMADFFHGIDGLGGIHESHPHLTPEETWKDLFRDALDSGTDEEKAVAREVQASHALFTPSRRPGHEEILRILKENERDEITIVAIGPLTNLAIAAAADPETFLRAREVVVMGGAVGVEGNVGNTPPSLQNPEFPCPPFKLIKQPPGPLRSKLMLRNQITPVAGAQLHESESFVYSI
jgi:inosine-uridine nucleoside N-ribohydrolase